MKFIGKLLLYILIALLVVILQPLFSSANPLGKQNVSTHGFPRIATIIWPSGRWITVFPRHHIVLENVTFGHDGQPATTGGQSVDIALSSRQLTEPRHV